MMYCGAKVAAAPLQVESPPQEEVPVPNQMYIMYRGKKLFNQSPTAQKQP
jgi:hypothetical protein